MPPAPGNTVGCIDPWAEGFLCGGPYRPNRSSIRGPGSIRGRQGGRSLGDRAPERPPAGQDPRSSASAPYTAASHRSMTAAQAVQAPWGTIVDTGPVAGGRSDDNRKAHRTRSNTAPAGYKRDFAKLNKAALKHGLVTAKEQMKYREVNPCFVKSQTTTGRRNRNAAPTFGQDHVYGGSTPASESVDVIMSYQAGKQWYQARHAQLLIQRGKEEAQAKRVHIGQPSTTRAVMLRNKDPPRTRAEILRDRPSKYATRAKPTVSTFRSEGDRMCAVKKHTSEAAMHEAQLQFGMGIRRCPVSSRNL